MAVKKRALIASGGTGGHFYPGFALAVELRSRGWQPLFLVKKEDLARPALEAADLPYAEIDMVALPRGVNPLSHTAFIFKFACSFFLTRRMIRDFKPDAVIGTGSYIAFPAVLAARLAGVPVYLHESNARFGIGNYLAAFFCRKAALGLPMEDNPFSARSALTGTPIREAFASAPDKRTARAALGLEADKFTVLVVGGSQGARRLNAAFVGTLKALRGDLQAVHLTGKNNFDAVSAAYAQAGLEGARGAKLFAYREDIPALYAAADLVVARSGASTVAELVHLKKPGVLVPLPSSAGGHQKANAAALASRGAAVCLEEGVDFDAGLTAAIRAFIDEPARAAELSANFGKTGIPDGLKAAAIFADIIEGKGSQEENIHGN